MCRGPACLVWTGCLLKAQAGSVRSLQEQGDQSWLAWGKGHFPGERDLRGEGQSRIWWSPDHRNASSVPAAELQGQPSGAC